MEVFHERLGILFGKPFEEELDFHVQDLFVTGGRDGGDKWERIECEEPLDAHLAVKEEKSSRMTLEVESVESLDFMFFSAYAFVSLVSSFSMS